MARSRSCADPDLYEYALTEAGRAVEPIVEAIGDWGHRWVSTNATLMHLDVKLLMWSMRRNINPHPMSERRSVVQMIYRDLAPAQRNWWLLVEPGKETDLCSVDPGFDVDLYITTDLRTMTEIWMGYATIPPAIEDGRLLLVGNRHLENTFQIWLGESRFASIEKCVA